MTSLNKYRLRALFQNIYCENETYFVNCSIIVHFNIMEQSREIDLFPTPSRRNTYID